MPVQRKPSNVPWRLRDQVQLRAVLAPLAGWRRREEVPQVDGAIQRRWQRAASRLHRLGQLTPAGGDRQLQARNCPSTFLMAYGKPRPCNLRTACPYCWARRAADVWDDIDRAFAAAAGASRPPAGDGVRLGRAIDLGDVAPAPRRPRRFDGTTLVVRERAFVVPRTFRTLAGDPVNVLRDFYGARLGREPVVFADLAGTFGRAAEVRADVAALGPATPFGCFENVVADLGRPRGWRVAVRQVWLLPAGRGLRVIPALPGERPRQITIADPRRAQVMRAVAAACRYPRAMLARPERDPERDPAPYLLEARLGLRLAATYGAFRKPHGRPRP